MRVVALIEATMLAGLTAASAGLVKDGACDH
jgi:hypothetical protein